jgi:large subunit ribosomal protein L6
MSVDTRGNVSVASQGGSVKVERHSDERQDRAFHGLYYRLITSAIEGVTKGYQKSLELQGVGYKAEMQKGELALNVGRTHQVRYAPPAGVKVEVPAPTQIVISGIDKQAVHQAAAYIRAICPPEPYKGKGIRYQGEIVRKKVGKTGAAAK